MVKGIDHNIVLLLTDRWNKRMPLLTVSPKYQVVIPKEIRERMDIKPGQEVDMIIHDGMIVLVPLQPIEEMRGIAKGIDVEFKREPDREL
jgi:AbrB family looped-hinge helix DNA binding protein